MIQLLKLWGTFECIKIDSIWFEVDRSSYSDYVEAKNKEPLFTKYNDLFTITFGIIINKLQIKYALEVRFSVKVTNLRTMNFKGKKKQTTIRSAGNILRTSGNRKNWKKAVVTLADGNKIDFVEGEF